MRLEQRTAALLAVVAAYREQRCAELLTPARAQARALLAGALRDARRRVHTALAEERHRAAIAVAAADAQLATETRLAAQRRDAARLASGWTELRLALQARWDDPATRRQWVAAHLARARQALVDEGAPVVVAVHAGAADGGGQAAHARESEAPSGADAASARAGTAATGAGAASGRASAAATGAGAASARAEETSASAAPSAGATRIDGTARPWLLRGPAGWPADERAQVAATLRAQGAPAVEFEPDAQLSAGFRVQAGHNALDATLDGLLADRSAVQGRLLQLIEERG